MPIQSQHPQLGTVVGAVFETASDKVQAVVAASAITLPWWLPDLQKVSEEAALLVPVLGCVWFAVQITLRVIEFRRKQKYYAEQQNHQNHQN